MKESLETIVEEIYALDASLKERDELVRTLVGRLIEARPTVSIDATFVANLRAQVLSRKSPASVPSPYMHTTQWWLLRAMPLGAVAVVLLLVVGYTDLPTQPPSNIQEEKAMETMEADSASQDAPTFDARMYSSEPVGGEGGEADMFSSEPTELVDDSMMMKSMPQNNDPLRVLETGAQVRYVQAVTFTSVPGFIAVYAGDAPNAPMLGVSAFVSPGIMQDVMVPTSRPLVEGEVVTVRFVQDSGDGIFNARMDMPYIDTATGEPLARTIVVAPQYIQQ